MRIFEYELKDFKIGQTIVHPLGGEAVIYKIEGERIYYRNGKIKKGIFCGFCGYCNYKEIKEIK